MTTTLAPTRVLATDDRCEILRLIKRTLGRYYACEMAEDVSVAREKLAHESFDLALCDIQMPGESGLVLAREILDGPADTAVVLVTAEDELETVERALEMGVHGYLIKPFWPGQLLVAAMTALRRRQLEVAARAHSQALEDRLQMLMDRAPVPMYIKDRERRYMLANRVAHELAGLEPYRLIGLSDSDFMSPAAELLVAETDRLVLEEGGTFESEETLQIGGEEVTFDTVKFPFVDHDSRIVGVAGISTDVTERKRAERLGSELAETQRLAIEELQASQQETVERLAKAIEMHDAGTGQHINRMASVAAMLGSAYGLGADQVRLLRSAAPMHDVGKVATPDAILRKEGPLSEAERREMQRHTLVGCEILTGSESELLQMAARVALTHHERWDGGGYPHGLAGEAIPIESRIVAVADVFDALLSQRSYRPAMSAEEAMTVIRGGSGSHFDAEIVALLEANLERALALRG